MSNKEVIEYLNSIVDDFFLNKHDSLMVADVHIDSKRLEAIHKAIRVLEKSPNETELEHSCCYWQNDTCVLGHDCCPDNYNCDDFD